MHDTDTGDGSTTTTYKVMLEWMPSWRNVPLVLQSKRFLPVGGGEAKARQAGDEDVDDSLLTEWVTIYDGAAPKAEVGLNIQVERVHVWDYSCFLCCACVCVESCK